MPTLPSHKWSTLLYLKDFPQKTYSLILCKVYKYSQHSVQEFSTLLFTLSFPFPAKDSLLRIWLCFLASLYIKYFERKTLHCDFPMRFSGIHLQLPFLTASGPWNPTLGAFQPQDTFQAALSLSSPHQIGGVSL